MIINLGFITIAIGRESIARQDRDRSCASKLYYGSEATAQKSAQKVGEKNNTKLEAYKCRHCAGWHIGHSRD